MEIDMDKQGFLRPCRIILFSLLCLFFPHYILANPQVDQVVQGSVDFTHQSPNNLTLIQNSKKVVINWKSFNIDLPESTEFIQPNANSIALNRINPANGASQILGKLKANGQIWLINPAGVLFGKEAKVDVGGLLATTADIKDEDFMYGNNRFEQSPTWNGSIINKGEIQVNNIGNNGYAALMAPGVQNAGIIKANLGKVVLASGTSYMVNFADDQLISFGSKPEITQPGVDSKGQILKDAVANSGKIISPGGTVIMTARAAKNVVDNVINMSGVIEAQSAYLRGGKIILEGGDHGIVNVSGHLNATGYGIHKGGLIKITGEKVGLYKGAVVDASGNYGGGTVLIGGDYRGKNPAVKNAQRTFVDKTALIKADAMLYGSGGKVIVWSDQGTQFYGNISARGGVFGGDGGFVETSGKNYLDYRGRADTRAPFGKTGNLLLDPTNIYIALDQTSATNAGMVGTDTTAGDTPPNFAASGPVQDSLLTTAQLESALGLSNVTVTTANPAGTGLGDITVVDPVSWTAATSLTLTAENNVFVNAPIFAGGDVIINANQNITVANTGGITTANAIFPGGVGNTGNISLNAVNGAVVINGNLNTGNIIQDAANNMNLTSGNINVIANLGILGIGTLQTGLVQLNNVGGDGNHITTGSITLNVANGNIGLNAANALRTGEAAMNAGATNSVTTSGSFFLNALNINDGGTGLLSIFQGQTSDINGGIQGLVNIQAVNADITSTQPIFLGPSTLSGNLRIISSGNITQNSSGAGLTVAGTTNLRSTQNGITLDNPNNNFGGTVTLQTRTDATIVANQNLILGSLNIGGTLDVTTTLGNDIIFTGAANIGTGINGGNISVFAGRNLFINAPITIAGMNNAAELEAFNAFNNIIFNNGSVTYNGLGALIFTANTSGLSGQFAMDANSSITTIDPASVIGINVLSGTGGNTAIFGNINAAGTGAGVTPFGLVVNVAGSISQSARIHAVGPVSFTVTAPDSDIILDNPLNFFGNVRSFDAISPGNIRDFSFTDTNPILQNLFLNPNGSFRNFTVNLASEIPFFPVVPGFITGNLSLTGASILLGGDVSVGGNISLTTSGGIFLNSFTPITLQANNILFNGSIDGGMIGQGLLLDARNGNIIFNGDVGSTTNSLDLLEIIQANNVMNNGSIYVNRFIQDAGFGITNLGNNFFADSAFIATNNVIGHLDVGSLILNTNFANIGANALGVLSTVAGSSGLIGAHAIQLLNAPIAVGTHFFNGIDLAFPVTPVPPTPFPFIPFFPVVTPVFFPEFTNPFLVSQLPPLFNPLLSYGNPAENSDEAMTMYVYNKPDTVTETMLSIQNMMLAKINADVYRSKSM